jgi:2-polyprenyl-6-methoxyphenol hydroxylase-like FAD-dependent oxidoreductase
VIHARTLEVLESLQVTDQLRAQGLIVHRFMIRDRDRVLATIPFDWLPTRYPFTLMIPQQVTESILLARLRALGGDVHRPWTVETIRQEAGGVSVGLTANGHAAATIDARYVVGADGMHSRVREQAGIGFTGDAYAQSFALADVRMSWTLPSDNVSLFLSPQGLMVVVPLPHGRHRIVATFDDAPEQPSVDDMQRLLDTRGPSSGARIEELVWASRFRVHHRLADKYRAGRILLAGDAAHVHSPAGGQGMNTGIQDAVALGRALIGVLHEGRDAALDEFEERRRPVAARVVAFTDRMTAMATLRSRGARAIRNTAIRVVGRSPARRWLASELAGLGNR